MNKVTSTSRQFPLKYRCLISANFLRMSGTNCFQENYGKKFHNKAKGHLEKSIDHTVTAGLSINR